MSTGRPILFYDGSCGLCHSVVRFTIARDRRARFQFAPINGETWKSMVDAQANDPLTTVHLLEQGRLLDRSSAVCRLLIGIGGFWKLVGCLLWLVPRPLRNVGYRLVARSRYRIFGRVDACTLPAPGDMDRQLP